MGQSELEKVDLSNCTKLKKIASPNEMNFKKIIDFEGAFESCSSLETIPEDLFAYCPDVENFYKTFRYCSSLKSVPMNLFANCSKVKSFMHTFLNCYSLTGEVPKLWELVPNGAENDYIGEPDGFACFAGGENITDYDKIPQYWIAMPPA